MKIWDFIEELDFFYPQNLMDEEKKRLYSSYVENLEGIVISNKCEYDWKKVLQAIQRTYTYSKFPPLADIIKVLPEFIDKLRSKGYKFVTVGEMINKRLSEENL
ncbi:MAG: hypothetical protein II417_01850 [Elusimicrobia bacterium]|nr:hypothetical protein [Elusimicrobiota bacterium]